MVKAIIFDMDGLLVETESIHVKAFEAFLAEKGIETPPGYAEKLVGFSIAANVEMLKREVGLRGETDALVLERNARYLEMLKAAEIRPLPGVAEVFSFAGKHGVRRAVCSSSVREQVDVILPRLLAALGVRETPEEYFDAIVSGDGIEHLKPAPDIYLKCAGKLAEKPQDCVAFEDSLAGAQAASAAGMAVVAVPNPFSHNVRNWPTRYVFQSLEEALAAGVLSVSAGRVRLSGADAAAAAKRTGP